MLWACVESRVPSVWFLCKSYYLPVLGAITAQPCVLFFEIVLSVECFVYPTNLRIRVDNWNRIFLNSISIPFQPARVCWDGALDFNHSHSCNSSLSRTPLIPNTTLYFFVGCCAQTQTERRYLPFSETTTRHLSCRKEHSVLCYSCNLLYRHNLRNKSPGHLPSNFSRKNHTDELFLGVSGEGSSRQHTKDSHELFCPMGCWQWTSGGLQTYRV